MAGIKGEEVGVSGREPPRTPARPSVYQPPKTTLFLAYQAEHAPRPFTKAKSLREARKAARAAGLKPLQGQGIKISPILEYLHQVTARHSMAKRRWAGDFLLLDLRRNAVAIALSIHILASSVIHGARV